MGRSDDAADDTNISSRMADSTVITGIRKMSRIPTFKIQNAI